MGDGFEKVHDSTDRQTEDSFQSSVGEFTAGSCFNNVEVHGDFLAQRLNVPSSLPASRCKGREEKEGERWNQDVQIKWDMLG